MKRIFDREIKPTTQREDLSPIFTEEVDFAKQEIVQFYREIIPLDEKNKVVEDFILNTVVDPISRLVRKIKDKKGNGKNVDLPTLSEWQKHSEFQLPFASFQTILKSQNVPEDAKEIFVLQYITRVVRQFYQYVPIEDYQDPAQEFIDIKVKDNRDKIYKIRRFLSQMSKHGVDNIVDHYLFIGEIEGVTLPKDLDLLINLVTSIYRLNINLKIAENLTRPIADLDLAADISKALERKSKELKKQAEDRDRAISSFTEDQLSVNLSDQFKAAYEYLLSLIPKGERTITDRLPFHLLKLAMSLRRILPVANAEVLAHIWWQLRLGGERSGYILEEFKKELPNFIKKHHLEKYIRHLFDNYLHSEASAYEIQETVFVDSITPNEIIVRTIRNLLKNHIPKNQLNVRFTILIRDQKLLKISIPYRTGKSDEELEEDIIRAITKSEHRWKSLDLDDNEKARLSYLGYNGVLREKDKTYQRIYQDYGIDNRSKKPLRGDYLLQIGSTYEDSRDPRSLFAVDSHKMAVQFRIDEAGKLIVTTRYNHQSFDGLPANAHTSSLISDLREPAPEKRKFKLLHDDLISFNNFIKDQIQYRDTDLPLIESTAAYKDDHKYVKIPVAGTVLTPTDIRALVIACANNLSYLQILVAANNAIGTFYIRNPNANNIHPVVMAMSMLDNPNAITSFVHSKERARKGVSDVALFASIAGLREVPISYLGSILNPTGTKMLTATQGMISPVPVNTRFTTAFSTAYMPHKIDLNDPVNSIGVIGMGIDGLDSATYSVRLMPAHAQSYFRKKIEELFVDGLNQNQKKYALTEFSKIIQYWDSLVAGTVPKKKQISLDEFIKKRDEIIANLIRQRLMDPKKLEPYKQSIQVFLNRALQEAAKEVFNPEKISYAKAEIEKKISQLTTSITP